MTEADMLASIQQWNANKVDKGKEKEKESQQNET